MPNSMTELIEILLIESLLHHIDLTTQMLDGTPFQYRLHHTKDKVETIAFLRKEGVHKNKPRPDLILLHPDAAINFHEEIIIELESSKDFLHIPILLMTIKEDSIEISKAINKELKHLSTKKLDIHYFLETIVTLKKFVDSLNGVEDK